MPIRVEASELRGQVFQCLPGCAFCCLCQPGLTDGERARFTGALRGAVEPGGGALRVVGQAGPCVLLSAGRACTQYALRPRGCRSFPYQATLLWRTQVVLNRGCPGTWGEGPGARASYRPDEALPPGGELLAAEAKGREAWASFRGHARRMGVDAEPEGVRSVLRALLPLLLEPAGLARGLALADAGGPLTERALRDARAEPGALEQFLAGQVRATFAQRDPKRLPMFVDAGLRWVLFRARGGELERLVIRADGGLDRDASVPLLPLPLLPLDPDARALRDRHARVLVERDVLLGLAAFMLDRTGYAEPFASAALRELCAALGDLHVRAGIMARFAGEERVGVARMRDGVAFFDMDFLNSPSIGVAF